MVPYGRKSGTEHLKEKQKSKKKKKWFGAPLRSIKFYGHVPRVKFAMKLQLAFKSTKKSALQPPAFFFIYQMGENLSKMLVF